MDLHPVNDNNTKKTLEGFLKAVGKTKKKRMKNQRNQIK